VSDTELEGLLRRLAPQVLGAVVRRYGHFDTAEDAVQEALIAAARRWPRHLSRSAEQPQRSCCSPACMCSTPSSTLGGAW